MPNTIPLHLDAWHLDEARTQITLLVSSTQAEAARLGAPMALQVADRFHLLQNLADVLTDVFRAHAPQLAYINAQGIAVPLAPPQPSTRAVALAAARRAQRVACYQQVWTSHR